MGLLISNSKFGDCVRCGDKNTECRKRQKDLLCLSCCKTEDTQKQIAKANLKNRVRSLGNKQVQSGNYEDASRAALGEDLDYVVSRIIRLQGADERGLVKCYTCPKIVHFSMMDAGHFISRSHKGLRWYLNNIRPQCKECNQHKHGNIESFEKELELEQHGLPEYLREQSKEVQKPTIDEMKQLLYTYRNQLRVLENKFKTKPTT